MAARSGVHRPEARQDSAGATSRPRRTVPVRRAFRRYGARYRVLNRASTSGSPSNRENVPLSAISWAACRKPAQAVRASVPPTLTRRTPRDAATGTVMNGELTRRFTGVGDTASTIAEICSMAADPRGVEAVGAGVGVRLQPSDRLVDVGASHHEALASPGEHDAGPALVDRLPRGPYAIDGKVELVEGLGRVARRVLDRKPRDPGSCGEPHVRADLSRVVRRSRPRSRRSPVRPPPRRRSEGARAPVRVEAPLSARPSVHAKPALVVASASKPICSRARALPASHGFGMTKHPVAWSRRKASTRSSCTVMAHLIGKGRVVVTLAEPAHRAHPARSGHWAGAATASRRFCADLVERLTEEASISCSWTGPPCFVRWTG